LSAEHKKLKHSKELLADYAPIGLVSIDEHGNVIEINRRMLDILGVSSEEVSSGLNLLKFPPLMRAGIAAVLKTCVHTNEVINAELPYRNRSGEESYLREFIIPAQDAQGNVCGCQALIEDITEQKLAENALRESEERYRLLTQNSLTGIYIHQDGRFVYVNDRLAHMLEYTPEEIVGKEFWEFVHPADVETVKSRGLARSKGLAVEPEYEYRVVCKDGKTKWLHLLATTIDYRGRKANMGNVADITGRKLMEDALRESQANFRNLYEESKRGEELYRSLLDSSPDAIVVYDLDGKVQYTNNSFTRLFGWTLGELRSKRIPFLPDSERDASMALIESVIGEGLACRRFETKRYTKDGRLLETSVSASRFLDHEGSPTGMIVILSDITERKRLEEQLRHSAKMEAIGRLAGGVAHDFNNLLTAVIGYSDVLLQEIQESRPYHDKVLQINNAAHKAAALTRQLLAFSRKQVLDVRLVDLNSAIRDFEKILQRLAGEDIEFQTRLDQALGVVYADPSQIEQILMNLVVNARDAMPRGGKLSIGTANVILDQDYARAHPEVVPGPYVMLVVSDSGQGMDRETQTRIFDPFFTTKAKGVGTGLGMSTVYGIVKQHRGHINVYSEPGRGSSFKVYLPREDAVAASAMTKSPPGDKRQSHPMGTETVLVVEDEEIVRNLACDALDLLGYQVLAASNPGAAFRVSAEHEGPIHLLLADVILPQMDGKSLYKNLSLERGEMRVLYVSGYTEDFVFHHGVLDSGVNFLPKPFTVASLAKKVREVMDAPLR
ncbi:PAS domain S-box protein, partial [Thermodesulfobacteriota bacterium]